jgi:hypothetical protein
MADCTISRAALLALRDQLRERATRAHGWFEELTTMDPEPLNEYEARERVAALWGSSSSKSRAILSNYKNRLVRS